MILAAVILALAAAAATALGPAAAQPATPSAAFAAFERSLSPAERAEALIAFGDRDRQRLRLTPGHRGGLMLKRMDEGTRRAAFALVDSVLSARGQAIVRATIRREGVLATREDPDFRDPGKYYLAVFGRPGAGARWALRFEGHHLSLNVTLAGDRITSVLPLHWGANPDRLKGLETHLTPLFEAAEAARAAARRAGARADYAPVLARTLAIFPAAATRGLAARLAAALGGGRSRLSGGASGGDLYVEGGGAAFSIIHQSRNHLHLSLSDQARDYGGK